MIRWLGLVFFVSVVSCEHARYDRHPQPSKFPNGCKHSLEEMPKDFAFCPRPLSSLAEQLRTYCQTLYPSWREKKFPFPYGGPPVFSTVKARGQTFLWVQMEDVSPPGSAAAYALTDGSLVYCERGPSDVVGKFSCDYESFGQAPTKRPSPSRSFDACENLHLFEEAVKPAAASP